VNLDEIDPTFVQDLAASEKSVWLVARWMRSEYGLAVTVRPTFVRGDPSVASDYSDSGDLEISQRVEVKHRPGLQFCSLDEFPYSTVIVDVAHAWDNARPKPIAYVICNADITGAIIVDAKRTSSQWIRVTKPDTKRGRERTFYECPKLLCSYAALR
jgi:hypothetical protein